MTDLEELEDANNELEDELSALRKEVADEQKRRDALDRNLLAELTRISDIIIDLRRDFGCKHHALSKTRRKPWRQDTPPGEKQEMTTEDWLKFGQGMEQLGKKMSRVRKERLNNGD